MEWSAEFYAWRAGDPRPGWPFPFPEENPPPWPEDVLQADAARLRDAL